MVVSTASPYKFTKDVITSIDSKYASLNPFEAMYELEKISGVPVPEPIKGIEKRPVLHKNVVKKEDIKNFIEQLDVAESVKEELRRLSPHTYTGVCRY